MKTAWSPYKAKPVRYVVPHGRMSSAEPLLGMSEPVLVSFAGAHDPDFAEASKSVRRVINLRLLKKHLFEDSLALLSRRAEMPVERMAALLEANTPFNSGLAEHLEHVMGLPAGWLDRDRTQLTQADIDELKALLQSQEHEAAHAQGAADETSDQAAPQASAPQHDAPVAPAALQSDDGTQDARPQPSPAEDMVLLDERQRASADAYRQDATMDYSESLKWLKHQINLQPRGTSSKLANLLGRSPNDVSAWLNCLRPVPLKMREPLARAAAELLPELADEIKRRFAAHGAAPGADASGAEQPATAATAAVAPENAPQPAAQAEQPPTEPAQPELAKPTHKSAELATRVQRVGTSSYVSFSARPAPMTKQQERIIAMQTMQTVAEVMKVLVTQE